MTQELVRGKKMLTAGKEVVLLNPPTASSFPLRLAAVDIFSGVTFFDAEAVRLCWTLMRE